MVTKQYFEQVAGEIHASRDFDLDVKPVPSGQSRFFEEGLELGNTHLCGGLANIQHVLNGKDLRCFLEVLVEAWLQRIHDRAGEAVAFRRQPVFERLEVPTQEMNEEVLVRRQSGCAVAHGLVN